MDGTTLITRADLTEMLPQMLPRLWAFALRLARDTHDAEDLVQRTCVRALERSHQLRPDTTPLSWVFSVLHTIWINEVRARNVRQRSGIDWDNAFIETVAATPASDLQTQGMYAEIVEAVMRLPEAQRVVMLLVNVEELSYQEAADALNVPIGTIMSRLYRARQTIGARFEAGGQNSLGST